MLDEVRPKLRKTGPTFAGQTGGALPEAKPRVVGTVAIASSRPSSDTLGTPLQAVIPRCRQLKQFNHKITRNLFRGTAAFRSKIGRIVMLDVLERQQNRRKRTTS